MILKDIAYVYKWPIEIQSACFTSEVNSRKSIPEWHCILLHDFMILNKNKGVGKQRMFTSSSPPLLKHYISQ